MQAIARTLQLHLRLVRSYPIAALLVAVSFALVLWTGHSEGRTLHAFGYIIAVWFGAFLTDLIVTLRPRPTVGFPIHHSPINELAVILICFVLGLVFLFVRFSPLWPAPSTPARIAVAPLLVFAYPIALALIYLFVFRYRPRELGFNINYWYLAIVIHVVFGIVTSLVAPDKLHWRSYVQNEGVFGLIMDGIIGAALCEEFTRMLLMTRLAAVLRNRGLGFVLASYLWAAAHIPSFSGGSALGIRVQLIHVWGIVPIGLLWGYLTWRTRSLLPAVLVHGLNLWGLQNGLV
jgi:membrane protease YdiL (CAAX protease family)